MSCNTLLNGFDSDLTAEQRTKKIGLKLAHFRPVNTWKEIEIKNDLDSDYFLIDTSTNERYTHNTKCFARFESSVMFLATLTLQPIFLTFNLLNRIVKVVTAAHLWKKAEEKTYPFSARLLEFSVDILRIVMTPLILVGQLFASFYGAIALPYDGLKLYATLDRITFSGGIMRFGVDELFTCRLGICMQPEPVAHLLGGRVGDQNVL